MKSDLGPAILVIAVVADPGQQVGAHRGQDAAHASPEVRRPGRHRLQRLCADARLNIGDTVFNER